jgi:hypothetical protein
MTTKRRRNEKTLQNVFRRSAREWLYMKSRNMAKTYTRRDKVLLESEYYDKQGWGCLRKCWLGYKIAKSEGDEEKMIYYAKGIQRLQCELGLAVEEFPQLGLCAPSSHEAIEKDDDLFGIQNESYDIDENKPQINEFVEYEEYLSNLPMGVEPPWRCHALIFANGTSSQQRLCLLPDYVSTQQHNVDNNNSSHRY